jgi:uncharacterized Zn-binding protein involved in type VI secretion
MGLAAARKGDNHICGKGHPDNPVTEHSPDVRSGGEYQARILDACDCPDQLENIKTGSGNVLVNGLPCARITDKTIHEGLITAGFNDVLVGGPTVLMNIQVTGPPDFRERVKRSLAEIYSTPTGQELIRLLNEQHNPLRIAPALAPDDNRADVSPDGVGTIFWDAYTPVTGMWHPTLSLGHEMSHGTHNGAPSGANEERRTVGTKPPLDSNGNRVYDANGRPNGTHIRDKHGNLLPAPDFSNEFPSENSLRRDLGWPPRLTYNDLNGIKPGAPGEF